MSNSNYISDGGLKQLMKLRKADICKLYIADLNLNKISSNVSPDVGNKSESIEILQPSPTQEVLHKSITENGIDTDRSEYINQPGSHHPPFD